MEKRLCPRPPGNAAARRAPRCGACTKKVGASLFVCGAGQDDTEDCSIRLVGRGLQASTMGFEDDLANGQSNSRSGNLGREKWFENTIAILLPYPDACIFHSDRNIGSARHDA